MKRITIFLAILIISALTLSACVEPETSDVHPQTEPTIEGAIVEGNNIDSVDSTTGKPIESTFETTQEQSDEPLEGEPTYIQALVNVNIRKEPDSSKNNVIATLKAGDKVQLIARHNQNWYYIIYKGQKAYISANSAYTHLLSAEQASENNERAAKIESIISAGMGVLATPYEYGATRILLYSGAPNSAFTGRTFDCSSFVQYAFYIGASIKLQGDSRSQSLHGQAIEKSLLQRGDLIFMTTPARANIQGIEHIGHVAIYLGEGKILHTHGAGGVKVDLLSGVWSARYVMAKRMF